MVNIATITLLDLSIIVKEYSDLFKVGDEFQIGVYFCI